jgi:uncharacterized repeat protein (TIGR04052 family)
MRRLGAPVLLSSVFVVSLACGDDGGSSETEHSHDTEHETDPGTTSASTDPTTAGPGTTPGTTSGESSSGPDDTTGADSSGGSGDSTGAGATDVTLQFALRVGAEDAACGQTYAGVGAMASEIELRDARFYVSEIFLVDGAGVETEVALDQDGQWQYENVALLDFEDGTAACAEQTTAETNTTVRGSIPAGDYVGVHFTVGVPFELNHLDVDAASTEPPLNLPAMYWVWAAGHKFMRIDINTDEMPPDNSWNFHLGAQGCTAPSPMEPPAAECTRPARVDVLLPTGFDPETGTIVVDLEALYNGVDVTADTPMSSSGCMSFMPDAVECDQIFPNLGLDWATGDCVNGCADQTVFSVE